MTTERDPSTRFKPGDPVLIRGPGGKWFIGYYIKYSKLNKACQSERFPHEVDILDSKAGASSELTTRDDVTFADDELEPLFTLEEKSLKKVSSTRKVKKRAPKGTSRGVKLSKTTRTKKTEAKMEALGREWSQRLLPLEGV